MEATLRQPTLEQRVQQLEANEQARDEQLDRIEKKLGGLWFTSIGTCGTAVAALIKYFLS